MTRQLFLILGGLAVAAAAGGAWNIGYFDELIHQSNGSIAACEKAIKGSLVSPSSYRRVSVEFTPREPLTLEEFETAINTKKCPVSEREYNCESDTAHADALVDQSIASQQLEKEGRPDPRPNRSVVEKALKRHHADIYAQLSRWPLSHRKTGFVTLEYDADNSFGASLRASSFCRFGTIGQDGQFGPEDIILIGQ